MNLFSKQEIESLALYVKKENEVCLKNLSNKNTKQLLSKNKDLNNLYKIIKKINY